MKDTVRAVLREGVPDDTEGGEGHHGADGPEPVRAFVVDVNVSAKGVVEDVRVLVQGGVAPFIEV